MKNSKFMEAVRFFFAPILFPIILVSISIVSNNITMKKTVTPIDLIVEKKDKPEGLALKEIKNKSAVFTIYGKEAEVGLNESRKLTENNNILLNYKWDFEVVDIRKETITINVSFVSKFKLLTMSAIAFIMFIAGILLQLRLIKRGEVTFK